MLKHLVNGPANKATWPAAVNAAVLLINGRMPDAIALKPDELGLTMIIVGCITTYLLPNKRATERDQGEGSVVSRDSRQLQST